MELLRHESDSIRRSAVNELVDLTPHTEGIEPVLRRALRDEDSVVAGDAARARACWFVASPSVGALVNTLSHEDPHIRNDVAEALASIGPAAARATTALADRPGRSDSLGAVPRAACEALASIGPAAQAAVPQLVDALNDEFLDARIFAAGSSGKHRIEGTAGPRRAEGGRRSSRIGQRSRVGVELDRWR